MEATEWILARIAEKGMAVRGCPDGSYASFPVHLEEATYLVIYYYDDSSVLLLAITKAVAPPGDWY